MEALEQQIEENAGQRSQKGSVIGYCSCGATHPSRGLNAVGAARLDADSKELTKAAPQMIE